MHMVVRLLSGRMVLMIYGQTLMPLKSYAQVKGYILLMRIPFMLLREAMMLRLLIMNLFGLTNALPIVELKQ